MSDNLTSIKDNLMPKEWSSFRITLVLYVVILLLPFSFYFVYTSFQTMQNDTKIVRQSSWTAGAIQYLSTSRSEQQIQQIDKAILHLSSWVSQNSKSKLYIGKLSLSEDFSEVNTCWDSYKNSLTTHNDTVIQQQALQCYQTTDKLALIIEKMVYLKQKKLINLFYASLTIAMLLILLVIYFVRAYIHTQMKKHAIHDHDTKLFNKKYFMAELKMSCSRSVRHSFPISMLRVSINDIEKGNKTYSESEKRNTLNVFGILMHSLVRDGDIPCRYDDNHFLILLPFTEEHNAVILKARIEEALKKDKWMSSKEISFDFNITEFDKEESEKAFIVRTLT